MRNMKSRILPFILSAALVISNVIVPGFAALDGESPELSDIYVDSGEPNNLGYSGGPVIPDTPETEANIEFTFDGTLYISPSEYSEETKQELFLRGVSAVDEKGEPVTGIRVEDFGGFDINAEPDTEFIVTYAANHANGEAFTATREAYVIADEEAEPNIIFTFDGALHISPSGYSEETKQELFLRGVSAVDEKDEPVTEIRVEDFGGFDINAEPGTEFIVTYAANHANGEAFNATREAYVIAASKYDPQPTSMEEVQALIDAYQAAYQAAMDEGGFTAALEVQKPRWEFEVAAELMPEGWDCQLVDGDEDFGADYWTFFLNLVPTAPPSLIKVDNEGDLLIALENSYEVICITKDIPLDKSLVINRKVTINSGVEWQPTGKVFSLVGEGDFAVIDVKSGGNLTLGDIIVTHGSGFVGAGVTVNGGTFNMNADTDIKGNHAGLGGTHSVYVGTNGTFNMNGGTISDSIGEAGVHVAPSGTFNMNAGKISGITGYFGGGVYIYGGTFNMFGGTISGNTASIGGGVYASDGATFTMADGAKIIGNTSKNEGGGVYKGTDATFTMASGAIIGGTEVSEGNTAKSGGGLYIVDGSFELPDGAKIIGNTATNGGGVYKAAGATLTMASGAIIGGAEDGEGNTAQFGGGLFVNGGNFELPDGAKIIGNTATNGGGVYIYGGSFKLWNGAKITGNTATGNGGGVYKAAGATLTMASGAIIGGAEDGEGNTAQFGGGLFVNGGNFELPDGAAITGNTANSGGGGVHLNGGTFTMSDGTISDNTATGNGGGVYVDYTATFTMDGDAVIGGNTAYNGGGVYIYDGTFTMRDNALIGGADKDTGNKATASGGGVHVSRGTFTMEAGTIAHNTAGGAGSGDYGGGGVYVHYTGTFDLWASGIISDNTAVSGGGVYVYGTGVNKGSFTMKAGAKIIRNTAKTGSVSGAGSGGGGVYLLRGAFNMENGAVIGGDKNEGNTAPKGGGMFINDANFTLPPNAKISGNTAAETDVRNGDGGGVWVHSGTFTMKTGAKISGNTAGNSGGGVRLQLASATLNMEDGAVIGGDKDEGESNTARSGGGIYMSRGTTELLSGAKITGNTVDGDLINNGGGAYIDSGTFTMYDDAVIGDNTAAHNGGGVYVAKNGTFKTSSKSGTTGGKIIGNVANASISSKGGGGGIYTVNYSNLTISDKAVFSGNKATATDPKNDFGFDNKGVDHEIKAGDSSTSTIYGTTGQINWAGDNSRAGTHLLNNDDVNYNGVKVSQKIAPTIFAVPNLNYGNQKLSPTGSLISLPNDKAAVAKIVINGDESYGWDLKVEARPAPVTGCKVLASRMHLGDGSPIFDADANKGIPQVVYSHNSGDGVWVDNTFTIAWDALLKDIRVLNKYDTDITQLIDEYKAELVWSLETGPTS